VFSEIISESIKSASSCLRARSAQAGSHPRHNWPSCCRYGAGRGCGSRTAPTPRPARASTSATASTGRLSPAADRE
jgi:hypothetical protein